MNSPSRRDTATSGDPGVQAGLATVMPPGGQIALRLQGWRYSGGVWVGLVALVIVVAILKPALIEPEGWRLLLRQVSVIGLLAVGQTVVMLTAGIDLSVGSVVAVVNWVASSLLMSSDSNNIKIIPLCLGIGAFVGLLNGISIAKLRVPPFVMTLGMLFVVLAAGQWWTGGITSGGASDLVVTMGQGQAGPIPVPFLILAGVALAVYLVLKLTPYGRRVYALGTNPRAAFLAGVNTDRVLVASYIICGTTAALAGLLLTGFIGYGATTAGQEPVLLQSIAAVVIGGTVLAGGRGSIIGTVGGVLFLGLLFNLLVVSDIAQSGRFMAQGFALIVAAALYSRFWRRG